MSRALGTNFKSILDNNMFKAGVVRVYAYNTKSGIQYRFATVKVDAGSGIEAHLNAILWPTFVDSAPQDGGLAEIGQIQLPIWKDYYNIISAWKRNLYYFSVYIGDAELGFVEADLETGADQWLKLGDFWHAPGGLNGAIGILTLNKLNPLSNVDSLVKVKDKYGVSSEFNKEQYVPKTYGNFENSAITSDNLRKTLRIYLTSGSTDAGWDFTYDETINASSPTGTLRGKSTDRVSDKGFIEIDPATITGTFATGQTVTGQTSGSTGTIDYIVEIGVPIDQNIEAVPEDLNCVKAMRYDQNHYSLNHYGAKSCEAAFIHLGNQDRFFRVTRNSGFTGYLLFDLEPDHNQVLVGTPFSAHASQAGILLIGSLSGDHEFVSYDNSGESAPHALWFHITGRSLFNSTTRTFTSSTALPVIGISYAFHYDDRVGGATLEAAALTSFEFPCFVQEIQLNLLATRRITVERVNHTISGFFANGGGSIYGDPGLSNCVLAFVPPLDDPGYTGLAYVDVYKVSGSWPSPGDKIVQGSGFTDTNPQCTAYVQNLYLDSDDFAFRVTNPGNIDGSLSTYAETTLNTEDTNLSIYLAPTSTEKVPAFNQVFLALATVIEQDTSREDTLNLPPNVQRDIMNTLSDDSGTWDVSNPASNIVDGDEDSFGRLELRSTSKTGQVDVTHDTATIPNYATICAIRGKYKIGWDTLELIQKAVSTQYIADNNGGSSGTWDGSSPASNTYDGDLDTFGLCELRTTNTSVTAYATIDDTCPFGVIKAIGWIKIKTIPEDLLQAWDGKAYMAVYTSGGPDMWVTMEGFKTDGAHPYLLFDLTESFVDNYFGDGYIEGGNLNLRWIYVRFERISTDFDVQVYGFGLDFITKETQLPQVQATAWVNDGVADTDKSMPVQILTNADMLSAVDPVPAHFEIPLSNLWRPGYGELIDDYDIIVEFEMYNPAGSLIDIDLDIYEMTLVESGPIMQPAGGVGSDTVLDCSLQLHGGSVVTKQIQYSDTPRITYFDMTTTREWPASLYGAEMNELPVDCYMILNSAVSIILKIYSINIIMISESSDYIFGREDSSIKTLYVSGQMTPDDGSGTYTGTPDALIEKFEDVAHHLAETTADSSLVVDMSGLDPTTEKAAFQIWNNQNLDNLIGFLAWHLGAIRDFDADNALRFVKRGTVPVDVLDSYQFEIEGIVKLSVNPDSQLFYLIKLDYNLNYATDKTRDEVENAEAAMKTDFGVYGTYPQTVLLTNDEPTAESILARLEAIHQAMPEMFQITCSQLALQGELYDQITVDTDTIYILGSQVFKGSPKSSVILTGVAV